MIGTRSATAFALFLAICAVALGVTALALALQEDDEASSAQVVETRIARVDGDPVAFPLHDFYLSGDGEGRPLALYLYPPGYYGHVRGCRVLWVPSDTIQVDGLFAGPGLFVDPCGGARFDREGRLVAGDADRGLDYFRTYSELGGEVVDLQVLFCGPDGPLGVPVVPATPTVPPPPAPPPGTATAGLPPVQPPALTGTATATPTISPTATPTATPSPQPTSEPEECQRVGDEVAQ